MVAATLHGAIDAAGATTALPFEPAEADRVIATVDTVRDRLGSDEFDRAVARGRSMWDEEVVQMTLEHLGVLGVARRQGRPAPDPASR